MSRPMILALVLAGCWTGAPTSPVAPTPPGRCEIRDEGDVSAAGTLLLSVDGSVFATTAGAFRYLHVKITGDTATAKLENSQFELEGELAIAKLPVRPRAIELRDHWLEIRSANVLRSIGDKLALDIELPTRITPAKLALELPCHALTFETPPDPPDSSELETRVLRTGARLSNGHGLDVGRVRAAQGDEAELEVQVLETEGALARVRIDGVNPITVWVDTTDIESVIASETGLYGIGMGGRGTSVRPLMCDRDVPIFVRNRSRFPVRVGRIKAHAAFRLKPEQTGAELEIELGQHGAVPFIRHTDFAVCRPSD